MSSFSGTRHCCLALGDSPKAERDQDPCKPNNPGSQNIVYIFHWHFSFLSASVVRKGKGTTEGQWRWWNPQGLKLNLHSSTYSSGSQVKLLVQAGSCVTPCSDCLAETWCIPSHTGRKSACLSPTTRLQVHALNCATEKQQLSLPLSCFRESKSSYLHTSVDLSRDLSSCIHCYMSGFLLFILMVSNPFTGWLGGGREGNKKPRSGD